VAGNNVFPLGKLFLWIDSGFFIGLGFGAALSMEEATKGVSKRLLVRYFLYVLQFFSVEFNCTNLPFQRNGRTF
jgi:hypothetical protein